MPKVSTALKAKQIFSLADLPANQITQVELTEIETLRADIARIIKKAKVMARRLEPMEMRVLLMATGLKTEDEVKALADDQVQGLIQKRLVKQEFTVEAGDIDFEIECTGERRTVEWKKLYTALAPNGEADALAQTNSATPSYSYGVALVDAEEGIAAKGSAA